MVDILTLTMAQADAKKKYQPIGTQSAAQFTGMSLVPGSWAVLNPGEQGTAGVPAVGAVILTPIYVPAATNINAIWAYCSTGAASSVLHIGLYTNQGSAFTQHTNFGTMSGVTAGAQELAGTWTLPAGVLWMGWMFTGAAATFAGTNRPRGVPGALLAGAGVMDPYYDTFVTTGPTAQTALPASFTATAMNAAQVPIRFGTKVA